MSKREQESERAIIVCDTLDAVGFFHRELWGRSDPKPELVWGGQGTSSGSFGDYTASNMCRDVTQAQMTLATELSVNAELPDSTYPGYRFIPDLTKDDDGYYTTENGCSSGCSPAVPVNHTSLSACGYNQSTVAERIADCATVNGSSATWEGSQNGISGEATWYLVTKTNVNGYEVWEDGRTGLLWSDAWHDSTNATNQTNWCRASGNHETDAHGGYCDNTQSSPTCYVNYSTNSSTSQQCQAASPESDCAEESGVSLPASTPGTPVAPSQSQAFYEEKGYMLKAASGTSPSVLWRLPTMHDFEQAEIDGMRLVLPNMGNNFWSASVYSSNRYYAWYFDGLYGYVNFNGRSYDYAVRCVGH